MKEWFARNEETITKWMYRAIITGFAMNSVFDIVDRNASGTLGWACACLWCLLAKRWRDLVLLQDNLLTSLYAKIEETIENAKKK